MEKDLDELEAEEILKNYHKDRNDMLKNNDNIFYINQSVLSDENYSDHVKKNKTNLIINIILLSVLIIGYIVVSALKHEDITLIILMGIVVIIFSAIIIYTSIREVKKLKQNDNTLDLVCGQIINDKLVVNKDEDLKEYLLRDLTKISLVETEKGEKAFLTLKFKEGDILNFENVTNFNQTLDKIKEINSEVEIIL